jgi:hypothetical protein
MDGKKSANGVKKGAGKGDGKKPGDKKKRHKVVNGQKWCPPCGKWLPVGDFPSGSGQCAIDRRILQNLKNAADAQGQLDWYEECISKEDSLQSLVKNYKVRLDAADGKPRKAGLFPILIYRDQVKQEQSILRDENWEFMSSIAFITWLGKPKNGSVDPLVAKGMWDEFYKAPNAITDELGLVHAYKDRVMIRKSDTMKFRDGTVKSQGYDCETAPKKNASQEDIDLADHKMRQAPKWRGAGTNISQIEMASEMNKARAAAQVAVGSLMPSSAFDTDGRAAALVPDVRTLMEEDDEDKDVEKDEADDAAAADGHVAKKRKTETGAEHWFGRDEAINKEVKSNTTWLKKHRGNATSEMVEARQLLRKITSKNCMETKVEAAVVRSRLFALKLIMSTDDAAMEEIEDVDTRYPGMPRSASAASASASPMAESSAKPLLSKDALKTHDAALVEAATGTVATAPAAVAAAALGGAGGKKLEVGATEAAAASSAADALAPLAEPIIKAAAGTELGCMDEDAATEGKGGKDDAKEDGKADAKEDGKADEKEADVTEAEASKAGASSSASSASAKPEAAAGAGGSAPTGDKASPKDFKINAKEAAADASPSIPTPSDSGVTWVADLLKNRKHDKRHKVKLFIATHNEQVNSSPTKSSKEWGDPSRFVPRIHHSPSPRFQVFDFS